MKFQFSDARLEHGIGRGKYDLLVGAIATFTICVGERELYREVMFPMVELAVALQRWLGQGLPLGEAFEFVSLESDDHGLVWIQPSAHGWRVGSLHQEYPELKLWSTEEVADAVGVFVDGVERWLTSETGVNLASLA
jgi:hypothetical protein